MTENEYKELKARLERLQALRNAIEQFHKLNNRLASLESGGHEAGRLLLEMEAVADGIEALLEQCRDIAETEGYRYCFHQEIRPAVAELRRRVEEESGQR
jgi:hypothetical protein